MDDPGNIIAKKPDDAARTADGLAVAGMLSYPFLHESRWEGSRAVVRWNDLRVRLNTEKGEATINRVKPALAADKKPVAAEFRLTAGGVIRAVELVKRYVQRESNGSLVGSYRVEVLKPGSPAPKTLMDGACLFTVLPSPDGKRAVVHCATSRDATLKESKPGQDMLFLIDGTGAVTDEIDLAK